MIYNEIVVRIIEEFDNSEINLITLLNKIKEEVGKVPRDVSRIISEKCGLPISVIEGVLSFYSSYNGGSDGDIDQYFLNYMDYSDRKFQYILDNNIEYKALKNVISKNVNVIDMLEEGKIKGKSGSGYSISAKWLMTKKKISNNKYIIANASEGEGDTYKDLQLMLYAPQRIIEGIIICGIATGIHHGYIYVRSEYETAEKTLKKAIEDAEKSGYLGKNILYSGFDMNIEIFRGGGAYICGEETSLLQSLEGKRGEPRLKPPFPGEKGLFDEPTIINNVESFAGIPMLINLGTTKIRQLGTENAGGTKLYTVTGCVKKPGVYEMNHGITVRELLNDEAGGIKEGYKLKGFQIGGGTTGCIVGVEYLDLVLDYQNCINVGISLGTGSVHFFCEEESVINMCKRSMEFLMEQSCGMCTPCRFGLLEIYQLLEKIIEGCASISIFEEIIKLGEYVRINSRCGLGQAAFTTFSSAYIAFKEEFENACKEGI